VAYGTMYSYCSANRKEKMRGQSFDRRQCLALFTWVDVVIREIDLELINLEPHPGFISGCVLLLFKAVV